MKKFLFVVSVLMTLGLSSSQAQAFPFRYIFTGWVGGYYSSWGYFPWYGIPAYPLYGYSYWPAFNYAPYYSSFGAISASPSARRVGVSWGKMTRDIAMADANAFCGAADCAPVVWVQGGCAAVAKSAQGQNLAWGYHAFKNVAISNALLACQRTQEPGCHLEAWVCSY